MFIDLKGKIFNKWTVIERDFSVKSKRTYFKCVCSCGNKKSVLSQNLINGQSKMCKQCSIKEFPKKIRTHGMHDSSEYVIWRGIKCRCLLKTKSEYYLYGERGITICDEWKNSFENFFRDMGPRPSKKHSIDRIDNEKGYFKENCRWANVSEQQHNRRIREESGIRFKDNKWYARITINRKEKYLGCFLNKEDAKNAYLKEKNKLRNIK